MQLLVRMLYAAAAGLARAASAVVPLADAKTAVALRARRGIRHRYAAWAAAHRDPRRPLLWMHAPSVGEGLMARPVLSLVRSRHPEAQLAFTFFSPSAADFSRGLDVDFRDYLPFDGPGDMRAALDALAPRALVFSKLDVWPELVRQASRRRVALGMVSAALGPASRRRGALARTLLRDTYASLDAVGAVDAATAERLVELGVRRDVIVVTGDTRFDQVWERAQAADLTSGLLGRLASARPTLVAGSTWPPDEAVLLEAVARVRSRVPGLRVIVAPHDLSREHLDAVVAWARQHQLALARVDEVDAGRADVILVDRYGVLADLYAHAQIAFVGGGFHDKGLHSVLEPAVFGAPVMFGPRHTNSRDAALLLEAEGARAVTSARDVETTLLEWIEDPASRTAAGDNARRVIDRGRGAAERSVALVERLLAS